MLIDHDIKETYKEAKRKIDAEFKDTWSALEANASKEYAKKKEDLTTQAIKSRKKYATMPVPVTVPPDLGELIITRDRDHDLAAIAEQLRVAEKAILETKLKKQAEVVAAYNAAQDKLARATRIKIVEAWLVEDSTIKAELLAVLKK